MIFLHQVLLFNYQIKFEERTKEACRFKEGIFEKKETPPIKQVPKYVNKQQVKHAEVTFGVKKGGDASRLSAVKKSKGSTRGGPKSDSILNVKDFGSF